MWRRLLIAGVLALASGEARAADILELLKTHKIVGGDVCWDKGSKPCNPPPMNARTEIRLMNDLIISRSLETKTGVIYPLNREDDIVDHPLMREFYRRQPLKHHYAKAQATVSGDTLVLTRKEGFEQGFGPNPRTLMHATSIETITIKDKSCNVVLDSSSRSSTGTSRSPRTRWRCELVPLETSSETSAGPKVQTLSFTRLNRTFAGNQSRENYLFTLLNDRLHYKMAYCSDNSQLTVQFDWRGGALKGTHRCEGEVTGRVSHHTLSYSSLAKIDGDLRHFAASGTHKSKGYLQWDISFEFDIRIVLDGGRCRLEKFYLRQLHGRSGPPFIYSSDSESECSLN
jgi:hypothetical protein